MIGLLVLAGMGLSDEAWAGPRSVSGCERWLGGFLYKRKTSAFLEEVHWARSGDLDLVLARPADQLGVDIPGAFLVEMRASEGLSAEIQIPGTRSRPHSPVAWMDQMPDADFAALLVPLERRASKDSGMLSGLISAGWELLDRVTMGSLFDSVQDGVGNTLADLTSGGGVDEAQLRELVEVRKEAIRADAELTRLHGVLLEALRQGRVRFWEPGAVPSPVTLRLEEPIAARPGARCALQETFLVEVDTQGREPQAALERAFPLPLQSLADPESARCQCWSSDGG